MIKYLSILFLTLSLFSCEAQEVPTIFSSAALNDTFYSLQDENLTFETVLKSYEGKIILIDVWASWCSDCLKSMPKVKALQQAHSDVVFLFLSLDKSVDSWKKGIKKYKVDGEHYYMQSGWKGDFGNFLDLDWIPRYLVIDKTGTITVFKAIKADDIKLKDALK